MNFTVEELGFLSVVKGKDREDTLNNIFEIMPEIEDEDIKEIGERVIGKLDGMSEEEFDQIN